MIFNQEILEAVAQTAATMQEELDERHVALSDCLQKLHQRDRALVLTRYEPGASVEEAARCSGRSLDAAYKALFRIRRLLFDCVTRRMVSGEAS